MTSTLTAATMTVTVTESINLNGTNQGSTNTLSLASIAEVSKRIVNVPASEVEVVAMSTAVAAGTFVESTVKYIRLTNLDDTNHITLTFKDEDNTEFRVKVDAGQSFIFNGDNSGGAVDTMKANGSALSSGLADLYDVTADADTASCDIEVFIASV